MSELWGELIWKSKVEVVWIDMPMWSITYYRNNGVFQQIVSPDYVPVHGSRAADHGCTVEFERRDPPTSSLIELIEWRGIYHPSTFQRDSNFQSDKRDYSTFTIEDHAPTLAANGIQFSGIVRCYTQVVLGIWVSVFLVYDSCRSISYIKRNKFKIKLHITWLQKVEFIF